MSVRAFVPLVALLAFAPALPAGAAEACHLTRITQVPMSIDGSGRVNVPMQVGTQTLNLLIDTGGVNSLMSEGTAASLGLKPEYISDNVHITNLGGYKLNRFVQAHDVVFGGLKAGQMTFLVSPPEMYLGPEVQGILGPDILRAYDDDFDFANGTFALFERDRCDGSAVYWTSDPSAEVPFDQDEVGHIKLTVVLDGKEVHATVDTGASRSLIDLDLAEDLFGIKPDDPLLRKVHKTATGFIYKYPFKTLTFGSGVAVTNPDITLMSRDDMRTASSPHMLIGISVLRQLHVYISYRRDTMFVTAAAAH